MLMFQHVGFVSFPLTLDTLCISVILNNTSELHLLYVVPDQRGDGENLSQTPSKYDLPAVITRLPLSSFL